MSVSNTRLILTAVAVSALPISACSSRGQQTPDSAPKNDPTVQIEPDAPAVGPDEMIPFSVTCGSRDLVDANNPEVFRSEHLRITNDEDNTINFENSSVLPSEITFVPGSDKKFVEAMQAAQEIIGSVQLPIANGGAILTYRGTNGSETQQYGLTVSDDGTVSARPNPDQNGGVSVQSVVDGEQYINLAYFPASNGQSIESFLEPGKDEWDNVPDAPTNPKSANDHGFTRMQGGVGGYLNVPITRSGSQRAGAQVFNKETSSACVALTGETPIGRTIEAKGLVS